MASEMSFKALGAKGSKYDEGSKYDGLETFARPKFIKSVTLTTDEVTAVCPITGQPDWYDISVLYHPVEKCIESKTFKLFMHSLREEGMFCEALSARIMEVVQEATDASFVQVTITQKPRGGVSIISVAQYGDQYA